MYQYSNKNENSKFKSPINKSSNLYLDNFQKPSTSNTTVRNKNKNLWYTDQEYPNKTSSNLFVKRNLNKISSTNISPKRGNFISDD